MVMFGKNKKGSIIDIVYILVVLIFFGMVVLVGSKIGTDVNEQIQSSSIIDANTKLQSERTLNNSMNSIDNTFLFLTIFIGIIIMVLAALVRVHPIFIPIFFVAWIMLVFLAGIFSNIYQNMAAETQLAAVAEELLFITTILNALPIVIGVFGILLMVVMYKLWSAGQ
jgi:hypothetical protein